MPNSLIFFLTALNKARHQVSKVGDQAINAVLRVVFVPTVKETKQPSHSI